MFPFQKQKSCFCCPDVAAKSSPFSPQLLVVFSPHMLVGSLFSHMCYRNLTPRISQLLFSLQICFTATIFVFKLPSPAIWTVLHLKLNSLQTLLCNSPLWGTDHYLDWLFQGSFPWFSFLSGFQPPLECCLFSSEEIRISFWYLYLLCTSLKNIANVIFLETVRGNFTKTIQEDDK